MRVRVGLVIVVAMPLVLASRAAGQSVFVSGGGFANIQQFGRFSSQSPIVADEDLSDTTKGFDVAVGGTLVSHVAVQFEVAFPDTLRKTFEPSRPLPPLPAPPITTQHHVDYRSRHASVLVGYQTDPTRRVSAALLGGLMFVQERVHSVSTTIPISPIIPLPSESTTTTYRMAPVVGIDVPITAVSRLAVVPHARIYKLNTSGFGTLGIWPGLNLRWTF